MKKALKGVFPGRFTNVEPAAVEFVGGVAMSTRRVAMSARHVLGDLVAALLVGCGLRVAFDRALAYLLDNARRANLKRDRKTGRQRAGLRLAGVCH